MKWFEKGCPFQRDRRRSRSKLDVNLAMAPGNLFEQRDLHKSLKTAPLIVDSDA
jgi:hypothetical protein